MTKEVSMTSPATQVNTKFVEWNAQGLLALPEDSEESYSERVQRLILQDDEGLHKEAREVLKHTYDVDPTWVPVTYASKGLYPWEAGCTWYGQNVEDPPLIQLSSHFADSQTYLGIYQRDEVLAHEYVHAVRAPLGSSIFEEIFSYLVSLDFSRGLLSRSMRLFRALFGPIFETPKESLLFVLAFMLLLAVALSEAFSTTYTSSMVSPCLTCLFFFCMAVTAYFVARLILRWWQWWRCKVHLEPIFGKNTLSLMLRLSDEEILLFSRYSTKEISNWMGVQQESNFRWRLLNQAYG